MINDGNALFEVIALLSTAILIVSLFLKLNISPILGYFVAGAAIGTHGFKIVEFSSAMEVFAEFGIVFLLFLIGLELTLDRIMSMRRHVFGLGTLQVIVTAAVIVFICRMFGINSSASIIIGCAFALSSTAIVLQVLQETGMKSNQVGRLSIAVLLMQDFTVVPLLVFVALLGNNAPQNLLLPITMSLIKAGIVLLGIFIVGRLLLRPFFKMIASTKSSELFIATTLLIVLGAAYITEKLELSMAMGAFVAGLLLAETEYRHEVEQVIFPFKSLLLGLFFMTVGMSIDLRILIENIDLITGIALALMLLKASIIIALAKLFGFKTGPAINAGLLLAQGSEFALILFKLETSMTVLDTHLANVLVSAVTMSMAFTPLFSSIGSIIANKLEAPDKKIEEAELIQLMRASVTDIDNHVIIAGFGRVGKMVARMLSEEQVNYIIIDIDSKVVDKAQREGFPIFRGNINKLATLEAIAVDRASTVVLSMQNEVTNKKAIKFINEHFPHATIVARVSDFSDIKTLKKLGAHKLVPETYETGLQIGAEVLQSVGLGSFAIASLKERFRAGDYAIPKDVVKEE
ncbi:proton antiporter-2 family protein [Neorickettsia helminthoeca str. Oregon]|uniref:Proton antiporter-2 family protein n=1 Tax=Neorickettsia helminthoeca str. Oregon TaxID=1286528 RepID=X5H597_9RICK|nr:monovalent cation:proton antiporter-2 (CPA2) family protein [Neorickettsia helminthoeca]AHX11761.1 proton antiporter-2 family protein [Neorickettsia helminthoeca str. Oregon]